MLLRNKEDIILFYMLICCLSNIDVKLCFQKVVVNKIFWDLAHIIRKIRLKWSEHFQCSVLHTKMLDHKYFSFYLIIYYHNKTLNHKNLDSKIVLWHRANIFRPIFFYLQNTNVSKAFSKSPGVRSLLQAFIRLVLFIPLFFSALMFYFQYVF